MGNSYAFSIPFDMCTSASDSIDSIECTDKTFVGVLKITDNAFVGWPKIKK